MYEVDVNPISDEFLMSMFEQLAPVPPAMGGGISMPNIGDGGSMYADDGEGDEDSPMNQAAGGIGKFGGEWLKGKANDAGGFGNLTGLWDSGPTAGAAKGAQSLIMTPHGAGAVGGGAGVAGTATASTGLPFLGSGLDLLSGKKKSAGLGALGTILGIPFGPLGMAIGGMAGSMFGGGE